MRNPLLPKSYTLLILAFFVLFVHSPKACGQSNFRIHPYLQVYDNGKTQITWFSDSPLTSSILIKDDLGADLVNSEVAPEKASELYYTNQELGQVISGLDNGRVLVE